MAKRQTSSPNNWRHGVWVPAFSDAEADEMMKKMLKQGAGVSGPAEAEVGWA
jgi:hypothetical protein